MIFGNWIRTRLLSAYLCFRRNPKNQQGGHIKGSYLDEDSKADVLTAALDAESYTKAIEAHQKGMYVSLEGMIPEGNRNMDCLSFNIIAD